MTRMNSPLRSMLVRNEGRWRGQLEDRRLRSQHRLKQQLKNGTCAKRILVKKTISFKLLLQVSLPRFRLEPIVLSKEEWIEG